MTTTESVARPRSRGTAAALRAISGFFDGVFVVTIERNGERRRLFEADHDGLDFEYVHGVDGSREQESVLAAEYDDAGAQRNFGRSLAPGQIGCALSHRLAYTRIVERGLRNALILEDDAVFDPAAASSVAPVLTQLPDDWDMLYLHSRRPGENGALRMKLRYGYPLLNALRLRRYDLDSLRSTYSRPFSANLRIAGQHWLALAYAVTASAAQELLAMQRPIADVADGVTRRLSAHPDRRVLLSVPNLFEARRGMDSTIWNRPPKQA